MNGASVTTRQEGRPPTVAGNANSHGPVAAARVVALANALRLEPELGRSQLTAVLADYGEPLESLTEQSFSEQDARRLSAAVERLAAILSETETDRAASGINAILAECGARPRLSRHDGSAWHLHVDRSDEAAWDEWLLASGAHALAQLLSDHGGIAWGVCHAHSCSAYYLAVGPGPTRRFCSATCSSRARVAEHRRRKRAAETAATPTPASPRER